MHMADSSPFVFAATCAKCNDVRSQAAHGYRTLIELLDSHSAIDARCRICGQKWVINEQDRAHLAKGLAIFR